MQRRLFILFLLLSLIPAIAILAVNWQLSQRHLEFLDSPGLREALESSLALARNELNGRLETAAADLDGLVATSENGVLPAPTGRDILIVRRAEQITQINGEAPDELIEKLRIWTLDESRSTARISGPESDWVVAAQRTGGQDWLLARSLDPQLTLQLDAVSQGSARIRQMRLYYGDLLRGDTLTTLIILGLVVLIAALVLSRLLARRIARPIAALADGTRKVAEGDLGHRVDVDAPAELGQLVTAFNRMTHDLHTSKEDLIQAERVAAWQGVARRLAHEIKNPLTPITLAMHRIGKRSEDPAITDSVQTVLEETENLKRLANEFSQYARLPAPQPEPADLLELVRSVVELYVDGERLQVVWKIGIDPAPIRVDPGQIRQALANLVKNAVAATDGSGRLTVGLQLEDSELVLRIADSGPGLAEPTERVFEPYYTTKDTGTGLGLPISRKILEDHRGSLTAANRAEGGAVFRLTLPLDGTPRKPEASL